MAALQLSVHRSLRFARIDAYGLPRSSFSLSQDDDVERLCTIDDEEQRVGYVHEEIEDEFFANQPERKAESDKAWDAMHRALSDGQLTWDGGIYPLNHVVLGGRLLYTNNDFIMVLKTPDQVRDVAKALPQITEDAFRERYFAIDASTYCIALSEEDFRYSWHWFQVVREFWLRAAFEGRYVLFTADQ